MCLRSSEPACDFRDLIPGDNRPVATFCKEQCESSGHCSRAPWADFTGTSSGQPLLRPLTVLLSENERSSSARGRTRRAGSHGRRDYGRFRLATSSPGRSHRSTIIRENRSTLGSSAWLHMTIGTHTEPLGPGAAVVLPANVRHSTANGNREGTMTFAEFHTVPLTCQI